MSNDERRHIAVEMARTVRRVIPFSTACDEETLRGGNRAVAEGKRRDAQARADAFLATRAERSDE